ncbi:hypothetical protein EV421DRAFT_1716485, partial [Armillaria borealis]
TQRIDVSWCLKSERGTRIIPEGTIKGALFVQTPDFVQVTAVGYFTKLNIHSDDADRELDPNGTDMRGQVVDPLNLCEPFYFTPLQGFIEGSIFCFRACDPAGTTGEKYCQPINGTPGCELNMPTNYDAGVFESCLGDSGKVRCLLGSFTLLEQYDD